MNLLTICIPTYKREKSLQKSIESVTKQIENYALEDIVKLYIANDASPDGTFDLINQYDSLTYFDSITREQNLGMSVNIKEMLNEEKNKSRYQLLLTDDDYLQPNILNEIVEFLKIFESNNDVVAIWTPRYSYTDDNKLHAIVCKPFADSKYIKPTVSNTGKYMHNGFVLSGLILKAKNIDFDLWEKYKENAYFPVILFGDILMRKGAYFWNKNIVHHTVLNECHWERWGKNDFVINFRLFSDSANTYRILATRIKGKYNLIRYYLSTIPSYYNLVNSRLKTGNIRINKSETYLAVRELKSNGFMTFDAKITALIVFALLSSVNTSALKIIITWILRFFTNNKNRKDHYNLRINLNLEMLRSAPVLAKCLFS